MRELIKKLRHNSGWRDMDWRCITDPALLVEAADALEAQEARIAQLEGALEIVCGGDVDASNTAIIVGNGADTVMRQLRAALQNTEAQDG